MRVSQSTLLPVTPTALSDARALVSQPDLARGASASLMRLAWLVVGTAHGRPIAQCRCANPDQGTPA